MNQNFTMVSVALGFVVFDVITGYVSAIKSGTLNSSVMRDGLWDKLGEVFAIALAFAAEFVVGFYGDMFAHVNLNIPITTGVCAYITLYELTSVIENIGKLNPELGKWLVSAIGIDPDKVNLKELIEDDD